MLNRKARVRKARKSTHWSDRAAAARSDLGSGTLALERTKSLQERNERAQRIANLKQANKDLYTLFTDMDTDNDGCLDTEEVYCRMTKMRGDVSEEFVEQMMSMVDSDGDGHIDFEEFVLASAAQRSTVCCVCIQSRPALVLGAVESAVFKRALTEEARHPIESVALAAPSWLAAGSEPEPEPEPGAGP